MEYSDKTVPLHTAIEIIDSNVQLQTRGVDCAIPYLVGPPGGGKTSTIKDYAMNSNKNWGFVSTHFALKPIEETGGIPQFERMEINGKEVIGTVWSFPDIFMELYKLSKKHEKIIWLLDDMHLCSHMHMTLLYELFTERAVRGYKLPENCAMVCAGNAGNKTGAKTLFSAIVNRVFFMPIHTDFDHWKRWAMKNRVNDSVISFLSNDTYRKYFHEDEQVDAPWSSPRSWTRLANMITMYEYQTQRAIDVNMLQYLAFGHVGKNAGTDFALYYDIYRKFDCEKILADADNFQMPESAVDRYALAFALTTYVVNKLKGNEKLVTPMAKIIINYMTNAAEIAIVILKEFMIYEKEIGKKVLMPILKELQKIDPNKTTEYINRLGEIDA